MIYVRTNETNYIVCVTNDIGIQGKEYFIEFENLNLEKSLVDEKGRYNYKLVNGEVVALTDEEKNTLFPPQQLEPSELELLKQRQEITEQALQDLILMTMGGE